MINKVIQRIFELDKLEEKRQFSCLSLIASENYTYKAVLKISSSVFANKYVEGFLGNSYYAGCKNVDELESITIEECKKTFACSYANVQSLSGSAANFSIYNSILVPGDTILSMDLQSGGHLTHGSADSFVGKFFNIVSYSVDQVTMDIDYSKVQELAIKHKPKLIIAGSSSFTFKINFKKFREIADSVNAYLLADICHLSGLIISKVHDHCFPHAHIAMSTSHNQLRGPRGAVIMWNDDNLTNLINRSVFPGTQGGSQMNLIAGKAIALSKANTEEFKNYFVQANKNAQSLFASLKDLGISMIGDRTDTHLVLFDVFKTYGITGDVAAKFLEDANIISNKNVIPHDANDQSTPSGIRLGTLSLTTLGFKEDDFMWVACLVHLVLSKRGELEAVEKVKHMIIEKLNIYKNNLID